MIWWQDYRYSKKYLVKWGTNLINSFKDVWLEVLIIYLHLSHCTRRPQSLLQIFFLLIDEETVETVSNFLLGGSKIAADSDCSHEIKRCLLLGKKVTTNLNSILKSRDITLPIKVCLVKAMVFPVVMYGCESWTVKKAERRRSDAFELWCWRRLLRVP